MNTLKEMGIFVGIPKGSMEVSRFNGSTTIGLGAVSVLVQDSERPSSMRAIIQRLQNLLQITLEAAIIGDRNGEEPFIPVIRLNASGGITWQTFIEYHLNGKAVSSSKNFKGSGGDFAPTQLGSGGWNFVVRRAGISNTGFVSLSKTLPPITVSERHRSTPLPPPIQPANPPVISASTEGSGPGSTLIVTGSGYIPDKIITVRVADDVLHERNFQRSSTTAGELNMRISLPCNSGLPFHVSATDSRPAPGILGVLFSNTITLLCS